MYNSQKNPPKTNKNTTRYLGYGIIFGTFFGVIIGSFFKYQVPSIMVCIVISMVVGYFLGKKKDKEVNRQLENLAYAVKESFYDKNKDLYKVTIVDKKGREEVQKLKANKYREMNLSKTELVYLSNKGKISPAYSHTREEKHKSILDVAEGYRQVKEAREENKKKEKPSKKENE